MSRTINSPTQAVNDNSTKNATTAYVDNAILGQNYKEAVKYASVAALPSIVYANGSSGVGRTLTGVALAAISLDGASPSINDRVLIKNQVSSFQNGIYTVTQTGSGIAVFILTGATDTDQSSDYKTGDSVFITSGSTLSATSWAYTGIDNPTIGTTSLTFVQIAGQGSFTGGNGITITGTSIAIDTTVTVDKTTAQALTNKNLSGAGNTFPTFNQNTAGSAAKLTTARTIGNTSFDGTAGVVNLPYIIKNSGIASSTTNSATEVNLVAIPLPILGANDQVYINVLYKMVGTVGTKTPTIRHSTVSGDATGTILYSVASGTASLSYIIEKRFWNANSVSAQIMFPSAVTTVIGPNNITPLTGAINTGAASYINLNGQCANSGDTIQVVGYTVTIIPGV